MARIDDIRGFTLLELLIAVVIVGLLASIAIPNLLDMRKRARTSEARANLGTIWVLQEAYRAENGLYSKPSVDLEPGQYDGSTGWVELGFYPKGSLLYKYTMLSANYTSFQAQASGNLDTDPDRDTWLIDELGRLVHTEID
jgi:prepilin-type N-terminal cleavage/methylation domain-containing protein